MPTLLCASVQAMRLALTEDTRSLEVEHEQRVGRLERSLRRLGDEMAESTGQLTSQLHAVTRSLQEARGEMQAINMESIQVN